MSIYDVVVVGGGIIGASAAYHLAHAGFSVKLLEADDYASGATGRTSRLQHCGLTYYALGRSAKFFILHPQRALKAVRSASCAMTERAAFVRDTSNRCRPIEFYCPLYRHSRVPLWKARLAFNALDGLYRGQHVSLNAKYLNRDQTQVVPALRSLADKSDLYGTVRFTEYEWTWPERICIDTLMAARRAGAEVCNYKRVTRIEHSVNRVWQVVTSDKRTGVDENTTARVLVNAAGAWVDELSQRVCLGIPKMNQGGKGTNVAVRLPDEFRGIGIQTVMSDGAPFYVIPWNDFHFIGPADAPADPDAENFRPRVSEVDTVLREFRLLFPSVAIDRSNVLYAWSGVRPRNFDPEYPAGGWGFAAHDLTSRGYGKYIVYIGGLIMTHRQAGRDITRMVRKHIEPSGRPAGIDYTAICVGSQDTLSLAEAVRRGVEEEDAYTLADVMFRRTCFGWSADLGRKDVGRVAAAMGESVGWSTREVDARISEYLRYVNNEFCSQNS